MIATSDKTKYAELHAMAEEMKAAAEAVFGPEGTDGADIAFRPHLKIQAFVRATVGAYGCTKSKFVFVFGTGESPREAVDAVLSQLAEMPPKYTAEQIAATLGLEAA